MSFQPTENAIQTAMRNAQRDASRYMVAFDDIFPGAGVVAALDGHSRYRVWGAGALTTHPYGKCRCPQWERAGICKHVRLFDEERALLLAEEDFEAGADELSDLEARRAARPVGMAATLTRESHPDPLGIEGRACALAEYREGCACERCQKRTL